MAPIVAGLALVFAGIVLGGKRLREELQGRDVRHQFLDRGLVKLSDAFEEMLGATRLNYATCLFLLRVLRDLDKADPAAPRPDDLPQLKPSITDVTVFSAIGPSSRISDTRRLGELATQAFSSLYLVNLWFLTDIWLPVRGYYSSDQSRSAQDRKEVFERLTKVAAEKYAEAERFRELPRLLSDLALRTMEIGLNKFDDFWAVRKDDEIRRLSGELEALLERLEPAASRS
ncbi:MAG: hypothetical protein IH863_06160 [Chloroflexi bacterium]|nr:hypothetical protein [Chloroflexota bacterium]